MEERVFIDCVNSPSIFCLAGIFAAQEDEYGTVVFHGDNGKKGIPVKIGIVSGVIPRGIAKRLIERVVGIFGLKDGRAQRAAPQHGMIGAELNAGQRAGGQQKQGDEPGEKAAFHGGNLLGRADGGAGRRAAQTNARMYILIIINEWMGMFQPFRVKSSM